MVKLRCWWKGHAFDKTKYEKELKEYYRVDHGFKNMEELRKHFDNPPKPVCKRCKEFI